MYCSQCGRKLDNDDKFCRVCGHPTDLGKKHDVNDEEQVHTFTEFHEQDSVSVDEPIVEASPLNNETIKSNKDPQSSLLVFGTGTLIVILLIILIALIVSFVKTLDFPEPVEAPKESILDQVDGYNWEHYLGPDRLRQVITTTLSQWRKEGIPTGVTTGDSSEDALLWQSLITEYYREAGNKSKSLTTALEEVRRMLVQYEMSQ